jgi:hypothetical protein
VSERPAEVTQVHTRLLKCSLDLEESRAYWRHSATPDPVTAERAFTEYWFGARSLPRVEPCSHQLPRPLRRLPGRARRPAALARHGPRRRAA